MALALQVIIPLIFPRFSHAYPVLSALDFIKSIKMQAILPKVKCPCLLIFGQKDALVPVNAGLYLNAHIPDSRLLVLPKAAHAPFISHSSECAHALNTFWTLYDESF